MPQIPTYTYIFRRFSTQEGCTGQVIVLQSQDQLTGPQAREQLENLTHYPADEFVEIHQEPDTGMVLDTWEQAIENLKPADMDWHAISTYRNWWREEMLEAEERF